MEKVLVTGSAGFIGMHTCKSLLDDGYIVCGVDNMNNYYDVKLKKARLNILSEYDNFIFYKANISNMDEVEKIFNDFEPQKVVNLAAQVPFEHRFGPLDLPLRSSLGTLGFSRIQLHVAVIE